MSRLDELKAETYRLGELSLGSIQEKWKKCGNPNCRCADGDKHGPYYYLAYTDPETGRTTTTYLTEDELPGLRDRIRNFHELKADLQELVELEAERRRSM